MMLRVPLLVLQGSFTLMSRGISKGCLEASLNINCYDVTCLSASARTLAASSSYRFFIASPRGSHEESKRIDGLHPTTQSTVLLLKQLQYFHFQHMWLRADWALRSVGVPRAVSDHFCSDARGVLTSTWCRPLEMAQRSKSPWVLWCRH